MVAAVVAGERDGIAEVYDRYAASLYAYCHSMLPKPEAAEVVQDTFLIAVRGWTGSVILTGSMPGCMPSHATSACAASGPRVATAAALVSRLSGSGRTAGGHASDRTRGQVLTACADNSPTGRRTGSA